MSKCERNSRAVAPVRIRVVVCPSVNVLDGLHQSYERFVIKHLPWSAKLFLICRASWSSGVMEKRMQGRPLRGEAEVGPVKIIQGMQKAIRHNQSETIARKDVARFACVTPALVTYYFPERDSLIEAATYPIVKEFYDLVDRTLSGEGSQQVILIEVIEVILTEFCKNGSIFDYFVQHRRTVGHSGSGDPFAGATNLIASFFDRYGSDVTQSKIDGRLLTAAVFGICRSIFLKNESQSTSVDAKYMLSVHTKVIYSMITSVSENCDENASLPFHLSEIAHSMRT